MPENPSPLRRPTLRDDLPRYPPLTQLIRTTAATIPGPYAGSSLLAGGLGSGQGQATLYVASTQQLRTDTQLPRDREPCLAVDVNGYGLLPGYYNGRLAGSYNGLPVYEVCAPAAGGAAIYVGASSLVPVSIYFPGLTTAQVALLSSNLSSSQLSTLVNLNAGQLQVLIQLTVNQIQALTSNFTSVQISNLISSLSFEQLYSLVTTMTTTQLLIATSASPIIYQTLFQILTQVQINVLIQNLTSQQLSTFVNLTPCQIQILVQLSTTIIQTLTNLTTTQLTTIIDSLTVTQITDIATTLTISQIRILTNICTSWQIHQLLEVLTTSQIRTLIVGLTQTQFKSLMQYSTATIGRLVNLLVTGSDTTDLQKVLNKAPLQPAPLLGGPLLFPWLPTMTGAPVTAPDPLFTGYAAIVVDDTDDELWGYFDSAWHNLTGGSGSAGASGQAILNSNYTVTTTYTYIGNGGRVTLPNAGTYLITGSARGALTGASGDYLRVKIRDTTNSADVGSGNMDVVFLQASATGADGSVSWGFVYTPGTTPATLDLQASMSLMASSASITGSDTILAYAQIAGTVAPGSGTVTAVTGTANQITVATGTTTPALSLAGPHNLTTLTSHGILTGQGTSAIVATAAMTDGQLLVGQSSADPLPKTLSGSGATITLSAAGVLTVSAIANASLANSSVTVTAGTGLSGGGAVALGASVTLNVAASIPQAETIKLTDAVTNTTSTVLTLNHASSGTAAAGFGGVEKWQLQTTTTADTDAADVTVTWATATHASRKARVVFNVYDTAVREAIRIEASGTAAMVGFLGAAASAALASPNLGTLATTFGLATGTPTFGAANLTGTAPASILPVFVAAGASHAIGAVPDPGATAHSNQPRALGDTAAFVVVKSLIGYNFVSTRETTTSTTAVDLTTPDSVAFTLDETSDVLIEYHSVGENNAVNNIVNVFNWDTVDDTSFNTQLTVAGANYTSNHILFARKTSVAAGAHTAKVKHQVGAGTGAWSLRWLRVWRIG